MLKKQFYVVKDLLPTGTSSDSLAHAKETVEWLYRAQDATPDRGVSHSYHIDKGWAPSYPETTGYIIPTLLNWYKITNDSEAGTRAVQMADWESSIQLENGAVIGSVVGKGDQKPVVFNTGQVIFGWIAAYKHTGDKKYLDSAVRAADWLVSVLDKDFTWRKHGNLGKDDTHTYNVRVMWAVLELGRITGRKDYVDSMRGSVEWVLGQERSRGWFDYNCLNDNANPLLHAIAYTARGLLESGRLLNDDRVVQASQRTAEELMGHIGPDGKMPGRFSSSWTPAVKWSCLTGMAQMSIVWQKLYRLTANESYLQSALKVNAFLKKTHVINGSNDGIRGGIKGSHPINGDYGQYRLLNWAAKFFLDALLLELYPELPDSPDYYAG